MNKQLPFFKWGTKYLIANGYAIECTPELVLSTPWSKVIRFSTSTGVFYLKQTPPSAFLSSEPKIIRLLFEQFHARVPIVIAVNEDLHCFLMEDAGTPLREMLKADFQPELLCQAVQQYAAIQRATEGSITILLQLGLPDWRLDKLPFLYNHMVSQTAFLKAEGLTDEELQRLHALSTPFLAQCKLLSSYGIPETIGYHDFHDKNVLIDQNTKKMTFVDWGEAALIHPFFSLHTCLEQSIIHHGIKEGEAIYQKLQYACLENWLELASKKQLLEAVLLAKQIRLIWSTLACYQFMLSVDLRAYRTYYPNRLSPIADCFKKYLKSMAT
ncbi:aminoglycoside phosphotransferase family protein [Legionella cincinnatiensis]|uniref:Phosphotransferase enzyme family protein n=1 Tax=Legionella cincinnatiensis TaxID=28085 RepID=A0A378IEY8_9GAMM|nr:aminoglycoside phosphotransferase family protein [Legionella cincinnatiensis]KTC92245.1 Phosphotransferase enzyme family protein [Legionella cincinnatiensis]STX33450.1 Predicted phosphotransferase related to Ser/Thr protein kinases [Legionella cincinnatiensis]